MVDISIDASGAGPAMNLDDDETRLLDEISVQVPTKKTSDCICLVRVDQLRSCDTCV